MTFNKYSLKAQLCLAVIFIPLNFLVSYISGEILALPLFMDMIFVYAGSFFGIPCGILVGLGHALIEALLIQHNILHSLYGLCSITGTLLTWLLVTRHKELSWFRLAFLVFVSTVVISFEGSIIYTLVFAPDTSYNENTTILFLSYTLLMQNMGLQFSAFLARLPVNIFDKAIAVFGGVGVFVGIQKVWLKKD